MVWSIRGHLRPPIDQTGLVGAAIGLVLSGALVSAIERLEDSEPGPLWFVGGIVVYPLGAVIGYDLGTRGASMRDHGTMMRVAGYALALAGAYVFIAATYGTGVILHVGGRSPFFTVAYAMCVAGAGLGWMAAVRLANGFSVPAPALIGGSVVTILMAWIAFLIAAGAHLSRIDS